MNLSTQPQSDYNLGAVEEGESSYAAESRDSLQNSSGFNGTVESLKQQIEGEIH